MKVQTYRDAVTNRYTIYNSLFLNLPFKDIYRTGTLLPIFEQAAKEGYEQEMTPEEIVDQFLHEILPLASDDEKLELLFKFIQYVERQVVLFDSVEDAAYETINTIDGKGTFRQLFARVTADGLNQQLIQKLRNFRLRIVLTAHPTQFYPGHVLAIITDLEEAIRHNRLKHIDLLLQQLGKTPFINKEKPSPYDEAISLCWYLENIFYTSVPEVVGKIIEFSGMDIQEYDNPHITSIGFWPGGDRDGNPYVTHDITLLVAKRLKETVLKCYYRDIRILRRRLTFRGLYDMMGKIENQIFNAVYGNAESGYTRVEDLQKDLFEAREVLSQKHDGIFLNMIDSFILKVKIFGFHMASLDIRQDSRKHRELWNAISPGQESLWDQNKDYPHDDLNEMLSQPIKVDANQYKDGFIQEMLQTFQVIPDIQAQNGETGCHRYVISNTIHPADVLVVFAVAKRVFNSELPLPLDVIPLFESIEILEKADAIMECLYNIPEYRTHLSERANKQTIMLGFSDGTKDGGYLQANYSIFKAKEALTNVSRKHGINVVFFDGRGGPPARGGGNTHDFYASLGSTIENKEIQLTIQGQTISANFGKPVSCAYNIEQLITAGMENELYPNRLRNLNEKERSLLQLLAEKSYKAYQSLKNHDAFVPYLEQATPLRFFGQTNIGSRPAKRGGKTKFSFDDLRAIPFVGSWAQMKQNIPGFYGLGQAIEQMDKVGKLKEVRALYKNSLFFRALVGNSMQSLAKAYFPASAHIRFHKEFGPFWELLFGEYRLTLKWLLDISDQEQLLEDNVLSRESIRLRERIVLPLITIQQFALQQLLTKGDTLSNKEREHMESLILRCMYGIINAARNAA